jgi:fibronectin-binding autotransporter adhesin
MARSTLLLLSLWTVLLLACPLQTVRATITPAGDVTPSLPWSSSTTGYIGNTSAGTVTVDGDSDLLSQSAYIGYGSTATGVVTVSGTGSTWTDRYDFSVGYSGAGTLNISGGGSVDNSAGYAYGDYFCYIGYGYGSRGTVTVSGAGSTWTSKGCFCVGGSGTGALNITGGGSVNSSSAYNSYIGYSSGSKGTVTVSGAGSTWTSSNGGLCVGGAGTGTLNITSGGTVSDWFGEIGSVYGGSGTVTVDGTGSTWTNSHFFTVGESGSGTLNITNGGSVNNGTFGGCIGSGPSSTGVVTVSGAGSTWTSGGQFSVGFYGSGALNITSGGTVSDTDGYIGYGSSSTGTVTVSGVGSKWTNSSDVYVGDQGSGTLKIANGGAVSDTFGYIGAYPVSGSEGMVMVDGAGSKWTNNRDVLVGGCPLSAGGSSGTLIITNGGCVSNSYGNIGLYSGSNGMVMVDGAGSTWTNLAKLTVGSQGIATLNIANGGAVSDTGGSIGINSKGTVTVSGTGSTWTNSDGLCLGGEYGGGTGTGALNITGGGAVSDTWCYIGYNSGAKGTVMVDGADSKWTSGSIDLGKEGTGTLSITGGGAVTVGYFSINSTSLLAIDVGCGSSLTVGGSTGPIANSGKIRFLAGAGVAAGSTWSPILSGAWGGTGTYQALGGTLNTGTHVFTVSSAGTGTSGSTVTIDLASQQRVLVSDAPTGWSLGESFLATASSSTLTCTATTISGGTLTALSSLLAPDDTVLSGWGVSAATGYTSGNPVYLSFGVGPAQARDSLQVWQYSGSSWTTYSAADLTYDRTYASLTVTELGIYAVTTNLMLMGDANRDRTVNGADLNIVLSNYNQTGETWDQGDFNGDGTVNGADLNTVLSNYNQTLGVSSPNAPVPEPATLSLLLAPTFAILAQLARKRRKT